MTSIAKPESSEPAAGLNAVLYGRRSIRRFSGARVPRSIIMEVVNAAIWAPSAHNRQPWRFAVIEDGHTRRSLASAMADRLRSDLARDELPPDVIEADASRSYTRLTGAPVLVVLCLTMRDMDTYPDPIRTDHEHTMAVQSTAMAGQNLLLSAHAHGLGACWMCAPLFVPDLVCDLLGLPAAWQPQALITLGYPAETRIKERAPLASRVIWK